MCDERPGVVPNGEHLGKPGDDLIVNVNWTNNNPTKANRCLMRFSTCYYCRLQVQTNASFNYPSCRSSMAHHVYDGWCVPGCTYIHLYDQDYSNQTAASFTSSSSLSSGSINFKTYSRFLYVIACANKTGDSEVFFQIRITAQDKTQYFQSNMWDVGRRYTFTSPLFPEEYVLNSETYKYVFQAANQDQYITISFDDWQLSQYSSILFDSANIKGKIWGTNYRPWIISDGHRLEMTFETGPYKIPGTLRAFKGFKATYMFRNRDEDEVPSVRTNCGMWIDQQESGEITFNPKGDGEVYYDCIWVVKKHPRFQRILIKVINFSTREKNRYVPNLLEVRNGLTSEGHIVMTASPRTGRESKQTFADYDSDTGFYVRVKGYYWGHRDFVLTFTSYKLGDCSNMFLCYNGRCIPSDLQCNGIDNCGDGSDEYNEYDHCGGTPTPQPSSSSSLLSPVIIIPMVVILFAIITICLLVLFIRRCRRMSCQARRTPRQQGRIATVSGNVSRQQRRRNRRRGEQRSERSSDHYHLHHDPPPSYEDVLNATPIGYLNLGFSDMANPSTGLIQPPSYDEATSPTTQNPPFGIPPGDLQDESSDSSLPDTVRHSQLNLSSSYSSDDTQRAAADRQRQRGTVSLSSSDSSNEGEGFRVEAIEGQRRGDGEHRHREESRQTDSRHTAAGPHVVKPEDAQIQLPVCPSADIPHSKFPKPHNKPQENEDHIPAVITECSASASTAASLSAPPSEGPGSSTYRVEASPMISTASAPSEGLSAPAGSQSEPPRERLPDPGAACSLPPVHPSPVPQSPPAEHQPETLLGPREARGRSSPGRRVPPHVLKARNAPSHTLMKHLSRSLNDLNHRPSEERASPQQGSMPSRHLSRSMQNVVDTAADRPHRGVEHGHPEPNRHSHHRSQTLPLNSADEPPGRNAVSLPQGQTRRARSDDFADRNQPGSDPSSHGHPDSRHRDQVRGEAMRNERPMNQRGEGATPPATRPKPQPKPRRLQHPDERTRPEPRQRQSLEGYSYRPSETARSPPEFERGYPHNDRNLQNLPQYQEREGARQARANRPPAPPRPQRLSRSLERRGQDPPRHDLPAGGNRETAEFSKDGPTPSSHGQNLGPPYRHTDPPPYRPRHNNNNPRPTSLNSPTHSSASRTPQPSEQNRSGTGPGERAPRQNHPPHSRSAGSFPRMGVQAVPRSGQPTEGVPGCDPDQGSSTREPPAHSHSAPTSPHRSARPDTDDPGVRVMPGGAGAPFLTLQMDGEEEDIYV